MGFAGARIVVGLEEGGKKEHDTRSLGERRLFQQLLGELDCRSGFKDH